jgi:hypothetical protein
MCKNNNVNVLFEKGKRYDISFFLNFEVYKYHIEKNIDYIFVSIKEERKMKLKQLMSENI